MAVLLITAPNGNGLNVHQQKNGQTNHVCIHLDNSFNFFGRKIQEKTKHNGVLNMLLNYSWIFGSGMNL